jgi:lipoprotein NlpI
LQLHAVRLLRKNESLDRTASSTIRFLQRETGLEQGVYSGEVTASILVSDLRVGDTLEFAYSLHGQNPVFGGKFVETASWDQTFPTTLRRIIFTHRADKQISWRLIGDRKSKPVVPTEVVRGAMRRLVFEERSIAKVDVEPSTPPSYLAHRRVQFSEFPGWNDVVAWASTLFRRQGELSQDVREVIEKLRQRPTDEDRVVAALEFVQSEIRYFSVSLGESSHRPSQPDVVVNQRYGDCKDKSLLLMTLLEALGIQSKPVLLAVGIRRGLENMLPSPQLFNHAIVQATVNGKVFYLDPTLLGQHGRLERMGQIHEGTQVLVIAPESRQLSTIATPNVRELMRSEVAETATVTKLNADGELQVRQVWRGAMAEALRLLQQRLPATELVKFVGDAMEMRYPGAKLVGEPDIVDDRGNNVFTMTAQYSVPKLAVEHGAYWYVRFSPANMIGVLATPPASTRTTPLQLPVFPYDARYTFEIKFPSEVNVISLPRTNTVDNKYFTYTVKSSFRGNNSKSVIELATFADQVEISDLKKYTEDMRSLSNVVTGVVVVPKSAIRAKSITTAKKDIGQTVRDQLNETVDKTSLAIRSGKLVGADLAGAYCLRASARSHLGMPTDALADANEAMKLMPNSSEALRCRADALFDAGEFEKAITDYSKSIALGATDAKVLQLRGIAKFYAGKLAEAAEDLARASDDGDKESQVYSDLWLSWTYQRLGQPLPEALLERAAASPRGDWPRPALAVIAGKLSPEEMLKLLERKGGDDRKMASSVGYFYLGQYYIGRGDKTKAREFFERARQANIVSNAEHKAAGFELHHLGAAAGPVSHEARTIHSISTGSLPAASAAAEPPPRNLPGAASGPSKAKNQKPPRKPPEPWTSSLLKGG